MPVTMSDVARHAGVSKATVSRVINARDGHASQETIARVQQAIEELGYVPNRVAANLKKSLLDIELFPSFFGPISLKSPPKLEGKITPSQT